LPPFREWSGDGCDDAIHCRNHGNDFFLPEGEKQDDQKDQAEFFNVVGNGFFNTMGYRWWRAAVCVEDAATSQKVIVINQSLARKRFPNENRSERW